MHDLPLSPKQILSIAGSDSRINAWTGAIRSGKTTASLLRWLIYVATAPPGELIVVAKTGQTATRNIFAPLQDFSLFGELAGHTKFTAGAPSGIILGRRVWVMGTSDVRAESRLRGLTCAGCYVDEASLVGQAFFMQLLGRMSVPGAKMFLTSNPDNPNHWLRRDYLQRADALDITSWHFILDDNPSLTPEFIKAIKAEFTGLWYRRFILGEWVAAEGAVYDGFDVDQHVVDICPVIKRWLCLSMDYGTVNPFHALLIGLGADNRLYVVAEWRYDARSAHRQLTDAEYSTRLREWLGTVQYPGSKLRGVTPEYLVVDPSAASFRQQLHADHLQSIPGDNAVLDGIRQVASLIGSGRLLIHSSCQHLIGEMTSYVWDDAARLKGEDRPVKLNDHGVDALRYGIMTTRSLWRNQLVPAEPGVPYELTFQVA